MKNGIILLLSIISSLQVNAGTSKVNSQKTKTKTQIVSSGCSEPKSIEKMGEYIYKALRQSKPEVKVKKEVKIAIIDTGIDFNNTELRKRLWTPRGKVHAKDFGENLVDGGKIPQDSHGHGTHIAGIILGLFPQAKVYSLHYYNPKATGIENLERFYKAIHLAIEAKVDIINISGGGPVASMEELEVLKQAREKNILVVAAGGNDRYTLSKENTYYPAQYNLENIISIKSLDEEGRKLASSNDGVEIQVGALGKIYSYVLGNCGGRMVGTSQSTAVVSALAAMLKSQNPEWGYKELKEKIIEKSQVNPYSEKVVSFELSKY